MTVPDEQLQRLAQAFAKLADETTSGQDPIDAELIWQAANGELPAEQTRQLVERAARCPETAEAWRLALALKNHASLSSSSVIPLRRAWTRRWAAGLAAAAVLVVGAAVTLLLPHHQPEIPVRAPEQGTITNLCPTEALPRTQFVLHWSKEEGARDSVIVSDRQLQVIARASGVTNAELRITAEQLHTVADGDLVLWQVERERADGSHSSSPTYVQRLQ